MSEMQPDESRTNARHEFLPSVWDGALVSTCVRKRALALLFTRRCCLRTAMSGFQQHEHDALSGP